MVGGRGAVNMYAIFGNKMHTFPARQGYLSRKWPYAGVPRKAEYRPDSLVTLTGDGLRG